MKKIREWFSLQLTRNPGRIVLFAIMFFNFVFLLLSAFVISRFGLSGTENMGMFEATFYTITMILDAGCISYVIADIGQSGTAIAIICLCIVIIGMVSFTGAVIGYITNYISSFIENANTGKRKIYMSNHIVILNWNTRASEIVNDLLFCRGKQNVVVLCASRKEEIELEINERLADTIQKENKFRNGNKLTNNVRFVVREGDVFSAKQLNDISLDKARAVIILGDDVNSTNADNNLAMGNAQTIKTLMQVSDIVSSDVSRDNQKIIVEITDEWTAELVDRIIKYKQVDGKCNIVPVRVNEILGQILSQFSLMPELNLAYRELFSNKGATFCDEERSVPDENEYITKYLNNHSMAIPLSSIDFKDKKYFFYSCDNEKNISKVSQIPVSDYSVKINRNYWIEKKNVIILGHNSKCRDIMRGFCAFRDEWNYKNSSEDILNIMVIDDKESLEKMDYYKEYPFVNKTVAAKIYDKELICSTIEEFVDSNEEDTSVLILSDDNASNEDIDANALANLIYIQDIIANKIESNPDFDPESIDIIVEIIDPKHHDIIGSYSVNNIVISNRYISKMITQIGEKEAIFNFYSEILTYDTEDSSDFESKEVYCKKVSRFFDELPGECTQLEFVRAVWKASIDASIPQEQRFPTIAIGFVKPGGKVTLFMGDMATKKMKLDPEDKIIVYSNH